MPRGDRHGNREATKPKKLKPKEIGPISTLASIQKKALEAPTQKRNKKNSYDDSDLGASFLIEKRQELCRVGHILHNGLRGGCCERLKAAA
jgi:hypothetical protein